MLDFMTSTWPLFSPRLHEHGLLDDRAGRALNELHDYLKSIADDAHEGLFTLDGANNTEEWEHVQRSGKDCSGHSAHHRRTMNNECEGAEPCRFHPVRDESGRTSRES